MIEIFGSGFDAGAFAGADPNPFTARLLAAMDKSDETFAYDSPEQLRFELAVRKATVQAARDLYAGNMEFAVFRKSRCNPAYWNRTQEGGFALKNGVLPADAIRDIYKNPSEYATECATAVFIVFYKAVLDVYGDALFNKVFPDIELMNWHHVDPLFRRIGLMRRTAAVLPGDRQYFINPDVNPEVPEWQGENVIVLGDGTYYGHGLGIYGADEIIRQLNENRRRGGRESAYLIDQAGRPDYRKLYGMTQTGERNSG